MRAFCSIAVRPNRPSRIASPRRRSCLRSCAIVVVAMGVLGSAGWARAQSRRDPVPDGTLDSRFGAAGLVSSVGIQSVIQADGKVVAIGGRTLVRYNIDGSVDTSFGIQGVVPNLNNGLAIVIQPDGKLLAATGASELRRYTTDGTLDPTFGSGGRVVTAVGPTKIAIGADGRIVAIGNVIVANNDLVLQRFHADGTVDATFGRQGLVVTNVRDNEQARAVLVQPDGRILVASSELDPITNRSRFMVLRYQEDGQLDSGFGVDGVVFTDFGGQRESSQTLALYPDGRILAGGIGGPGPGTSSWDFVLARYLPDGSLDSAFNGSGTVRTALTGEDTLLAAALQVDGTILAAGASGNFMDRAIALVAYNPDGTLSRSFGTSGVVTTRLGPVSGATDVDVYPDGAILTTGGGFLARYRYDSARGVFGAPTRAIPAHIEAGNYDLGGQGVGYSDLTDGTENGRFVYRLDDVDIKVSREGGHAVGWLAAGEWLAYTVDVDRAGVYAMSARVGSALPGRTFHIEVDGTDVTGPVAVPQVNEWDSYGSASVPPIFMTPGRRVLRVVMGPADWMDFQSFDIAGLSLTGGPYGGSPHLIPGLIEAEDYDVGGQGAGYGDSTPGNEGGAYRSDDVDLKVSREGGFAVGWLMAGEWLAYTVDVQTEGNYTLSARVGSMLPGRTFHIEVAGEAVTGPIAVPVQGDWDTYDIVSVPVHLPVGRQIVRVVMGPEDWMDLQSLTITP